MRIAILGAGLTGLIAARELVSAGCSVTVFDKARAAGGRMTTKQGPCGPLDIGAQYFTARTSGFRQQVDAWLDAGIVAQWPFVPQKVADGGTLYPSPDETTRYTGVGGMGTITDSLTHGMDLRCSRHASGIARSADGWRIHWSGGDGRGDGDDRFDGLLLTLPLEQLPELVGPSLLSGFALPPRIHVPCHAVGIATNGIVDPEICGIFGDDEVAWVSRQSSKPGCEAPDGVDDVWMLHFSPRWSARAGRAPDIDLVARACDWLARMTGVKLQVVASQTHYWAYANLDSELNLSEPLFDAERRLAVAGAWCAGGRVEGAFVSAQETCARLLAG